MATNPDLSVDRHSLYSMEFDGTKYISIPATTTGTLNTRSVSFWFKTSTISSFKGLMKFDTTNGKGCIKVFTHSSKIQVNGVGNNGVTNAYQVMTSTLSNDTWYHICIVSSPNTPEGKIYVNSVEDTNTGGAGTSADVDSFSYIGKLKVNSRAFNGQIDEVAIWSSDQTSNISNIYNGGSPGNVMALPNKPYAYYPLGEQARNTGYLSSGSDVSGSEWQFPNQSLQSTVIKFENSGAPTVGQTGDKIELASTINLGTQNTISFWFKAPPPNPVTNDRFCMIGNQYTSGKYTIFIFDNQILYRVGNNTGGYLAWSLTGGGSPLLDDKWHNIILNRNGASTSLYIDGVNKGNPTTGTIVATDNTFMDTIGSTGPLTINYYYNGEMSNVVAWDSDQTSEKDNIYNNGTPATSYTNNPTAWYKLNAANSSYAPYNANFNNALSFNGSNNYIDCGNDSSLRVTPNLTVSAWFKTSTSQIGKFINRDGLASGTRDYALYQNGTNLQFWVSQSGNITETVLTSTGFTANDGNWHHAVGVCNGTNIELYIDGVLNVSGTNSIAGINTSTYINEIGSRTTGTGNFFNGSLSNISLWNTALTSSQITEIYNNGTPQTSISYSPISWWKLDAGGTTITDYGSGGNNGTNNGATLVSSPVAVEQWVFTDSAGSNDGISTTLPTSALVRSDLQFESPYSNYSLSFDGVSNYFISNLDGTSTGGILAASDSDVAVSASFWFKLNNTSNGEGIWQWGNQLTDPTPFILFRTVSGPDRVSFYIDGAYQALQAINLSQWYHVVLTRTASDNTWRGYLNGNSTPWFTKDDGGAIGSRSSATDIYFGNGYNGYAPCSIDEFAVWNSTLTQAQVNQIYNNGLAADLTSLSPVSWWRLGEDAYFVSNNITIPNQITGGPSGTGSGTQTSMLVADAPGSYGSGSGVNLDIVDRIGEAPGTSPINVANSQSYNMIPDDRHPYVPGYVPAQVNNVASMDFDGVNDYFDLGSGFNMFRYNINESYTISLWYKTTSALGDRTLINLGANTYKFFLTSGNGGKISFGAGVSTSNAAVYNWLPTAGAINDGEWHHICIVQDSSSGTVNLTPYVDGSSSGSGGGTAFTVQVNNRIGLGHYGGIPCGLDEVAIFNYALTPRQIKEDIYNASTTGKTADLNNNSNLTAPVAWYRMGD